jgi:hypothetical protein
MNLKWSLVVSMRGKCAQFLDGQVEPLDRFAEAEGLETYVLQLAGNCMQDCLLFA